MLSCNLPTNSPSSIVILPFDATINWGLVNMPKITQPVSMRWAWSLRSPTLGCAIIPLQISDSLEIQRRVSWPEWRGKTNALRGRMKVKLKFLQILPCSITGAPWHPSRCRMCNSVQSSYSVLWFFSSLLLLKLPVLSAGLHPGESQTPPFLALQKCLVMPFGIVKEQ